MWGILTEPLSGVLKSQDNIMTGYDEYIPAAHVKFIEQTGARVIPVSYKLPRSELYATLQKLSGLYLHGDTNYDQIKQNMQFVATFSYIVQYMFYEADMFDRYFPVFMMGNSIQSLLANRVSY